MKKFVLCLVLGGCASAQNAVTDWAGIVQPVINTPAKPAASLFVYRAYVQLAVYDAVMAIDGGFTPYAAVIPKQPGADSSAAVATAAYRATRPFATPAQSAVLDAQYETYMSRI